MSDVNSLKLAENSLKIMLKWAEIAPKEGFLPSISVQKAEERLWYVQWAIAHKMG